MLARVEGKENKEMKDFKQRLLTTTFLSCAPAVGCVIVGPEGGAQSPAEATEDDGQAASASRIRQSVSVADGTSGEAPRRITPTRPSRPVGIMGVAVRLDPPAAPPEDPPATGGGAAAMSVDKVVPAAAAGGSLVAIYGAGFGDDKDMMAVLWGDDEGAIQSMHDGEILVVLPQDAAASSLVVRRGEGRRNTKVSSDALTVLANDGGFGRAVPDGAGLDVSLWPSSGASEGDTPPDMQGMGDPPLALRVPDLAMASAAFGGNVPGSEGPAVAASMTTVLFTPSEADYEFCVRSNGAARFTIEGYELVVLPAGQGAQCNTVTLGAGGFAVQVDYVTGQDGAVDLNVDWALDDGESAPIPSSALSWLSK